MVNDPQSEQDLTVSGNQIDVRVVFRDKSVISAIKRSISWIIIVCSVAKKYLAGE
jgi:hypothetical protein